MNTITITEESFDRLRETDTLEPGHYKIIRHICGVPFFDYAHSYDGYGVVWYEGPEFENVSE